MAKLYFRVASDVDKVIQLREEIKKLKQELLSMDVNKAPAAAKALQTQIGSLNQEMNRMVMDAAKAGAAMENDYKQKIYQSSKAVNTLTEDIIKQRAIIRETQEDVRALSEKYAKLGKYNPTSASTLAELNNAKKALLEQKYSLGDLQKEQANARLSVKKLRDEYALYKDDTKSVVTINEGIGASFKKILAGIGGVAAIKHLGSEIINIRGQFRSMEVSLNTMIGEARAKPILADVKQYAALSPLQLKDVSSATEMMIGFNIEAEKTPRFIRAIGDISRGESQKFNSLTLAFSQMSAAGKLIGNDLNQMINAGFNPLQIISDKTGKSIAQLKDEMSKGAISAEMVQQAFIDVTSEGGKFYKMSENASKEMAGQMSMLQDAIDSVFNEIAQNNEGVIVEGIQMTTKLVENYESIGRVLTGLVGIYGVYRTAMILNAVVEQGFSKAVWSKVTATKAATVAQVAYNRVLSMNPYVAVGAAIVSLGIAMWTLTDRTTTAEKAQKLLNKEHEIAAQKKQELSSKTDNLISKINSETESVYSQVRAYKELMKLFPELGNMSFEEFKNLPQGQQKKIFLNINENREKDDAYKAYKDDLKKIETLQKQIQGFKVMNPSDSQYLLMLTDQLDTANGLAKLHKQEIDKIIEAQWEANTPVEEKIKHYEGVKAGLVAEKNEIEAALKKSEKVASVWMGMPDIIGNVKLDVLQKQIDETARKIKSLTGNEKEAVKNKAYWEKQKKEAEAALNAIDSKQKKLMESGQFKGIDSKIVESYKKSTKLLKDAETELKAYDSSSKQESAAEKLIKKQEAIRSQKEKIAEMERKQTIERQRQQEDLENQIAQSRIDTMDKGYEKEQVQRELNNKKEIQSLQRQKEDYISAYTQTQKELFDAQEDLKAKKDSKYKKKTFDSSSVSVDTTAFDALIDNISQRQLNEKIREQEESWNDYLVKFGNYQQKRKALIEKYDKEIAEAKNAGEAAILEKEKGNALDDLDNSVKNSATLMGQLFADASQKSSNEIQKIIEKAELLMQYLGAVKDEQGNAQIKGKTVSKKDIIDLGISDNTLQNLEMSTEEVNALRNAIDKLKGDLGTKSPFKLFETQIKSAIEKISQGGKKNIAQGITEIGTSITSFAPVISQFGQDFGNIFGNDELGDKISGVADALGGLGQTATGVGQIMAGDIVGGAMSAVSGISSIVSALDGLFGANYDKYNKAKDEYESYISVLDDVIEKQKEMVASLDTQNASNTYDYAKSLIEKSAEAAKILGKERLNAGASAGSHSIGVRIRKGMSSEGWVEAEKALGAEFNKATEGRMTGLFDLSVEQLEKLQAEAPTFWAKLDDDVRTYLEDIIAANESAEDLKDTLNESLTGISFDSLFDNFLESLYDMESSAEDISDDMADYLRKSLIKAFAVENYKGKMQEWYTKWSEAMKNGEISSDEQKSLDDLKNSIITGATESAKLINDQFDYLKKGSSQSSSKGGFQAMGQDTGDELNGRFTALQMAGEEIKAQNTLQAQSLNILTVRADAILSINTETRNIADEIRTVQVNSYLELQEIRQNTGDTVKQLKLMDEKLKKIENNTNKL